jgi:hypothetical protein
MHMMQIIEFSRARVAVHPPLLFSARPSLHSLPLKSPTRIALQRSFTPHLVTICPSISAPPASRLVRTARLLTATKITISMVIGHGDNEMDYEDRVRSLTRHVCALLDGDMRWC